MRRAVVLALPLLALAGVALAQPKPQPIRFLRGTSGAVVEGAVPRGEVVRYTIEARAGQRMQVRIESPEANAVFQLQAPGGAWLPGAAEAEDARSWRGVLPATGIYLVTVGATRGGATYRLELEIN